MSRVTCHMSHVTCNFFFLFSDKVVELIRGGSVINGATPSSFSSMNKNIHVITTNPENSDKYSYMHNYIQPFSHKSKKCQISLYGCSPIQGTTFYSCWNLMKPGSQSGTYTLTRNISLFIPKWPDILSDPWVGASSPRVDAHDFVPAHERRPAHDWSRPMAPDPPVTGHLLGPPEALSPLAHLSLPQSSF